MTTFRVEEVVPGFWILRVHDRFTRFFEALWEIPEGITYNAYLLRTPEGDILFDTWKKPFAGLLLDALEELTSPDRLRYIVVHHMEPDHSGSLEDVLRWAPGARVVGHPLARGMLAAAYPRALERFRALRDGESIALGGVEVRFIHTPWLHWPETAMSWIPSLGVLVTGDAFGGYGIPSSVYDGECVRRDQMLWEMKKYVVTVIGHYRDWIKRNLEKLDKLGVEPKVIAPAHGLVWRNNVKEVIGIYRRLAGAEPVKGKVTVIYASMYGTVEKLVREVECRLARAGYEPRVYGFTDTTRPNFSDMLTDAAESEAIVIATPTYEVEPFPLIRYTVEELCWKNASTGRPAYVLASYGWGSKAAKTLVEKLEACGYRPAVLLEYKSVGPSAIGDKEAEEVAARLLDALGGTRRGG